MFYLRNFMLFRMQKVPSNYIEPSLLQSGFTATKKFVAFCPVFSFNYNFFEKFLLHYSTIIVVQLMSMIPIKFKNTTEIIFRVGKYLLILEILAHAIARIVQPSLVYIKNFGRHNVSWR